MTESLKIATLPGDRAMDIAFDACRIAVRLERNVEFIWAEQIITVSPKTDFYELFKMLNLLGKN